MKRAILVSLLIHLAIFAVICSAINNDKIPELPAQTTKQDWLNLYCRIIKRDNAQVVQMTKDPSRKISDELAQEIARLYWEQEELYGFRHGLVVCVVHKESWHDPKAISSQLARGLMQVQIVPSGKWAGEKLGLYRGKTKSQKIASVMNPQNNIQIGCYILNHYLQQCDGNLPTALDKYSFYATNYSEKVIALLADLHQSLATNQPPA